MNEAMEYMARLRHLLYIAEEQKKENQSKTITLTEEALLNKARDKWYQFKQFQRESNIFACLSIRTKLQLLGFDIAKNKSDPAKESEYESKYEQGDMRTPSALSVEGKSIWNYCNQEQERHSIRRTFAELEHQRWCANMICNGLIPSDKEEIKRNGGKILDKRLHGNLTTMEGLVEFRELIAKSKNISPEETDVIRYDYQLMDDVIWLLHKCKFGIISKQNEIIAT